MKTTILSLILLVLIGIWSGIRNLRQDLKFYQEYRTVIEANALME